MSNGITETLGASLGIFSAEHRRYSGADASTAPTIARQCLTSLLEFGAAGMRIGELSRRTGASIRSLRYYEEQNLLSPRRMASGYRVYADTDVVQVQRIQALLEAGLSTQKIERILPCMMQHSAGLGLSCADLYGELVAERNSLLDRIATLRASVKALDAIISASPAL